MPTSFLTREQRATFGFASKSITASALSRYFHLDGLDLTTTFQMRGPVNRLGFALLLCCVRFVGKFPLCLDDIPDGVIAHLAEQLDGSVPSDLHGYFIPTAPTYKRHTALIRARFGYRDFHNASDIVFSLMRRLYAFCWTGEDKPGWLFDWACAWLIESKALLPGATTLERLIGRVRDRAQQRLWFRLVGGLTDEQRQKIKRLFNPNAERIGNLELIRASPLKRRQSDFLRHLDRLDVLRSVELRPIPPKGVPAAHLERLARVARRAKPSAIAALSEPRRTATVAALFYTLEASAQDDAVELAEALTADLFREAALAKAAHRQAEQRNLDEAVLVLRTLAGQAIMDSPQTFKGWQSSLFERLPKTCIEDAIMTVDTLVEPDTGKPYAELGERWQRARKLFSNITTRIELSNSPGGQDVLKAMAWLRTQPNWAKADLTSAPIGMISKAWRPHVLDKDGTPVDAKAYVFATIDAWHKAVKRRDVFANPGIRYADPRAGLLKNREWEGAKSVVCRSLCRTLDAATEVKRLTSELEATFARVAARADDNPDLRFETSSGKPSIVLSKLDRLQEPDSLIALRRDVHHLSPVRACRISCSKS